MMNLLVTSGPLRRSARLLTSVLGLLCASTVLGLAGCERKETLESLDSIRAMQAAGRIAESLEPLRARLAEQPGDPESSYLYGRALVQTGQISLATWPLRQAMKDPAWMQPAATQLAFAGLVTGDFNEVVDVTTEILEEDPENVLALLLRAQAQAHWKKDPAAAIEDARRVLDLEPERLEAYEPLILGLLAEQRSLEARKALDEAGRKLEETEASDSQMAWHCATTALLALDDGEIDRGREIWDGCLERYPAEPNVVNGAVVFFDSQGDPERSIGILRDAMAGAADARAYRLGLAERLRARGRAEEGESLLREAIAAAEAPTARVVAWLDLAKFLHGSREFEPAADAVASALAAVEESGEEPGAQLLFQYADALLLAGRLDPALQTARRLSVPAQRGLIEARVLQQRGESGRAIEKFDEVLRLWPDNAPARYYAAVAAERVGDFDRALEEYRYALRIAVGATDARTRAARQLIAEGQPQAAYQLLFLESGKYPLEPEGQLLSMYLMGRIANPKQLQSSLTSLAQRDPARVPQALALGAEGVADLAGPEAALSVLSSAPGLDLRDPRNAPVLRALVRFAHQAERPEIARRAVDAAIAEYPEVAGSHEARAIDLELGHATPEVVGKAYARAVELNVRSPIALAGLASTFGSSDPDRALSLYARALEVDPNDAASKLAIALILRDRGELDAAAESLDKLLEAHPHEAEAAAARAELDLERDGVGDRTLVVARQAVRFGRSAEDLSRLARVHTALGQTAEAAQARLRAETLREAAVQSPSGPSPSSDE